EYMALVGPTGKGRKGLSYNDTGDIFEVADSEWFPAKIHGGLSSGEGLIWQVRDAITSREKVKKGGRVVEMQEYVADPGVPDKRLLVYEPEFANVLKQHERRGNTLSVILRQGWDGHRMQTMSKNSSATATGAHISIIRHITGEELVRYLTTTEVANGFGNRFLWVWVNRSKMLPDGGGCLDPWTRENFGKRFREALEFGRVTGELQRDTAARDLWHAIYPELSRDRPGLAGALLQRAEARTMRLACLYAILDRSAAVRRDHLTAALALWAYVEDSVAHIFGDSLGDPLAD